jgi:hypothetical protein
MLRPYTQQSTPIWQDTRDVDFIPAWGVTDDTASALSVFADRANSPHAEQEVRFVDADVETDRKRSVYLDWHTDTQEGEVRAFFNHMNRERLNMALNEFKNLYPDIKVLAVTMNVDNARAHMLFFAQMNFKRATERDTRTTWTFVCDLEERRAALRKRPNNGRRKVVEQLKPEPQPEFHMTATEYQAKQAELDALKAKIAQMRAEISADT